jgi:hypothetical protein
MAGVSWCPNPSIASPATHANGGTIGFSMSGPEQA